MVNRAKMRKSAIGGRRLLLFDMLGAALSGLSLWLLGMFGTALVGVGAQNLYVLAALAVLLLGNGVYGYMGYARRGRAVLQVAAIANLAYLVASVAVVWASWGTIRWFGELYFGLESAIVLVLVVLEWRAAGRIGG